MTERQRIIGLSVGFMVLIVPPVAALASGGGGSDAPTVGGRATTTPGAGDAGTDAATPVSTPTPDAKPPNMPDVTEPSPDGSPPTSDSAPDTSGAPAADAPAYQAPVPTPVAAQEPPVSTATPGPAPTATPRPARVVRRSPPPQPAASTPTPTPQPTPERQPPASTPGPHAKPEPTPNAPDVTEPPPDATATPDTPHTPRPKPHATPTPTTAPVAAPAAPAYSHVVQIVMENKDAAAALAGPYTKQLALQYGSASNFWNLTHPSLPNYIAAVSGGTQGITDDGPPSQHAVTAPSLFGQLDAAGKTWRSYLEDMPAPCSAASTGGYAVKHNPAAYFPALAASCARNDVPFTQFTADVASGLPSYALVVPNLTDDTHDAPVSTGDAWLAKWVPVILAGPDYKAGTTVVVVSWDESGGGATQAEVVVSPTTKAAAPSAALDHYARLGAIEKLLGVGFLGPAGARADDYLAGFGLSGAAAAPAPTPTATPTPTPAPAATPAPTPSTLTGSLFSAPFNSDTGATSATTEGAAAPHVVPAPGRPGGALAATVAPGQKRSELQADGPGGTLEIQPGTTATFTDTFYLQPGFPVSSGSFQTILQWKDAGGTQSSSPPLSVDVHSGYVTLYGGWGCPGGPKPFRQNLTSADIGVWKTLRVQAHFAPAPEGWVSAWVDGHPVVLALRPPCGTAYPAPYSRFQMLRIGLYRDPGLASAGTVLHKDYSARLG